MQIPQHGKQFLRIFESLPKKKADNDSCRPAPEINNQNLKSCNFEKYAEKNYKVRFTP
jgi:hypothetical protein